MGWSAGSWSHGGNEVASGNTPRTEGREEIHFFPPVSCWRPLWLTQVKLADIGA